MRMFRMHFAKFDLYKEVCMESIWHKSVHILWQIISALSGDVHVCGSYVDSLMPFTLFPILSDVLKIGRFGSFSLIFSSHVSSNPKCPIFIYAFAPEVAISCCGVGSYNS